MCRHGRVGPRVPLSGFMIMTGLYVRWAGFICSGEMAFAYFIRQFPFAVLPIVVRPGIVAESAIFNCFFFLYVTASGSGSATASLREPGEFRRAPDRV